MIPLVDLGIDKNLRGEIERAIGDVLDSSNFILGKNVGEFERLFANFLGSKFAIGVGSGTDAIRLSLRACGIKKDDYVLTVAFTSPFTAMAILAEGAIPVFCDIDEKTWTIDVSDAKRKISSKAKTILPVHIYGYPCDMEAVLKFARDIDLKVIEDVCQAHGASIAGRKLGTFGDAAAFSFYPTKNLGALGDGGAVTTQNKEIAEKLIYLRNGGQTKRFWHEYQGINSRLDEIQAAVLNVKLKRLDEFNNKRAVIVKRYKEKLFGLPVQFQEIIANGVSANHLFVIRTKHRDNLRKFLADCKVKSDIYYPWPLHLLPVFKKYASSLPVTEQISKEILALPLYPELSVKNQDVVIESIREFFGDKLE